MIFKPSPYNVGPLARTVFVMSIQLAAGVAVLMTAVLTKGCW